MAWTGFAINGGLRLTGAVWLNFMEGFRRRQSSVEIESLRIGDQAVPLRMVRNARARRYVLRLRADGSARVTIPRGGSQREAREFVERHRGWLAEQLQRQPAVSHLPARWEVGSEIWFRGELVRIEASATGQISLSAETMPVKNSALDLKAAMEKHLRRLAAQELPGRVQQLAGRHGFSPQRVTVRNQRSRWGSCSRRGTISLNWRLLQTPDFVRDYIILHELAHLRHMNHSMDFWREVERLCPGFREAERWLKTHRDFLR